MSAVSFIVAIITADSALSAASIMGFVESSRAFSDTGFFEKKEGIEAFSTNGEVVFSASFAVLIGAFEALVSSFNFTIRAFSNSFRGIINASRFGFHLDFIIFRAFSNASAVQVLE